MGYFFSILTLISIITAYIDGKKADLQFDKYPAVIGAFIFAAMTLFLAVNWNFPAFIAYQIVSVILTVIMSISFDTFMAVIIEEEKETAALRDELNGLGEFILNIGRFTPIFILLMLNVNFDNNLYIRIAFLLVAPLFLLIMTVLQETRAFK